MRQRLGSGIRRLFSVSAFATRSRPKVKIALMVALTLALHCARVCAVEIPSGAAQLRHVEQRQEGSCHGHQRSDSQERQHCACCESAAWAAVAETGAPDSVLTDHWSVTPVPSWLHSLSLNASHGIQRLLAMSAAQAPPLLFLVHRALLI